MVFDRSSDLEASSHDISFFLKLLLLLILSVHAVALGVWAVQFLGDIAHHTPSAAVTSLDLIRKKQESSAETSLKARTKVE